MAFIPTPNTVRSSIVYSTNGETWVNTLWFLFPGATNDEGLLADLNDDLQSWLVAEILTDIGDGTVLEQITSISQESSTAPSVTLVDGVNDGQVSSPSLPNNCAIAIKFGTNQRGRSGRGRNFIGGLTESRVTGNIVGDVTLTALQAGYAALNSYLDSGVIHVVVSMVSDGSPRSEGFVQAVTAYSFTNNLIDSQRRRL